MQTSFRRRLALLAVVMLATAPIALASGFHVFEQDAKASGQAVAFAARADNASANYYNPAAITRVDGGAASFGISGVFLGDTTFRSNQDQLPVEVYGPYVSLFSGGTHDMVDNTATPVHADPQAFAQASRFIAPGNESSVPSRISASDFTEVKSMTRSGNRK